MLQLLCVAACAFIPPTRLPQLATRPPARALVALGGDSPNAPCWWSPARAHVEAGGGGSGGRGGGVPKFPRWWSQDGPGDETSRSHWAGGPWRAYRDALEAWPLPMKALSASLVGGLGDMLSQIREVRETGEEMDSTRLRAVMFDGMCISGPGLHVGYSILERVIPCANRGSIRNAALQVIVDECIFDPAFIAAFFFSTGFIEGQNAWTETLPNLRRQFLPTLKGAWVTSAIFTPIQFFSFRYLPVSTRVLVVNCCDVAWYAAVSLGRHRERVAERLAAVSD